MFNYKNFFKVNYRFVWINTCVASTHKTRLRNKRFHDLSIKERVFVFYTHRTIKSFRFFFFQTIHALKFNIHLPVFVVKSNIITPIKIFLFCLFSTHFHTYIHTHNCHNLLFLLFLIVSI